MDLKTCRRGHPREGNAVQVTQSNRKDKRRWRCRACEREWAAEHRQFGPYEMDPVKVDRIAAGEWIGYIHKTERRAAVLKMTRLNPDMSVAQMARNASCDPTTVRRIQRTAEGEWSW